ncbi:Uncharacterised protein [Flavonifractor plautii]|uniref:Uncharacterized protein n=1 Tax=Flavonifractor plautii TaxID=292800 RepID=A0A6N3G7C4_FLAPL
MPVPVIVAFRTASIISSLTLVLVALASASMAWISSAVIPSLSLPCTVIKTVPSSETLTPTELALVVTESPKSSSVRFPVASYTESATMFRSTPALLLVAALVSLVVALADMEPSSSLMPLKLAESAMRLISLLSWLTSFWSCLRSVPSSKVPLADCSASSYMRLSMSWTSVRAPSAVCTREMPSLALSWALSRPVIWARIFSEMARPAASSPARLIL